MLRRQMNEAPPSLFRPVVALTLNVLCPVYEEWLDSAQGLTFLDELVGLKRYKPAASKLVELEDDYASGW